MRSFRRWADGNMSNGIRTKRDPGRNTRLMTEDHEEAELLTVPLVDMIALMPGWLDRYLSEVDTVLIKWGSILGDEICRLVDHFPKLQVLTFDEASKGRNDAATDRDGAAGRSDEAGRLVRSRPLAVCGVIETDARSRIKAMSARLQELDPLFIWVLFVQRRTPDSDGLPSSRSSDFPACLDGGLKVVDLAFADYTDEADEPSITSVSSAIYADPNRLQDHGIEPGSALMDAAGSADDLTHELMLAMFFELNWTVRYPNRAGGIAGPVVRTPRDCEAAAKLAAYAGLKGVAAKAMERVQSELGDVRQQLQSSMEREKELERQLEARQNDISHAFVRLNEAEQLANVHAFRSKEQGYRILQLKSWLSPLRRNPGWIAVLMMKKLLRFGRGRGYREFVEALDRPADPSEREVIQPFVPPFGRDIQETGEGDTPEHAEEIATVIKGQRSYTRDKLIERIDRTREAGRRVFIQSPVIDWNTPLFQRPQQMATALASQDALVVYMTQCFRFDSIDGSEEIADNLIVTNDGAILDYLRDTDVIVYSTATPFPFEAWGELRDRGNRVFYEYVDHIDAGISGHNLERIQQQFDAVSGDTIDFVVYTSRALRADFRESVPDEQLVYVPNGVDLEHYQNDRPFSDLSSDMRKVSAREKPIVGYFGAMAPWIDFDLMNEVARNRPDLEFIYIGPDYNNASRQLEVRDNVTWLGPVNYQQLPAYAQCFDVGIIPFRDGRVAETTSPLKLFEYFAIPVPVVVTDNLAECVAFSEVHRAAGAAEFGNQLDQAIEKSADPDHRRALIGLARDNSWSNRAKTYLQATPPPA